MSRRCCVLASAAIAALAVLTFGQAPAFPGGVDPVPLVRKGDPAMSAAFAHAAATLDALLAAWRHPPLEAAGFAVKLGFADAEGAKGFGVVRPDSEATAFVEWFWRRELQGDGERFAARVHGEPASLRNVRYGQLVSLVRADIGDWMYWRDGKIVGNATARPALAYASAQERRQMKDQYGIACD